MLSMSLASIGWAILWADLFLVRYAPEWAPSFPVAARIASAFAVVGFLAAVWGFRARLAWLLVLAVPIVANGTLLVAPWALSSLRIVDDARGTAAPPAQR
jgi:hypothetical protein